MNMLGKTVMRLEITRAPDGLAAPPIQLGGTASSACAIAIIGAGFSGTMAAIHLRRLLPPDQVIFLIERSGRFARGLAYADTGAAHLLNVRAANMSAFPDDAGHFERWVEANAANWPNEIHRTPAGIFATRRVYGRYLRAALHAEINASGGTVRLLADEVQALAPTPGGWRLACRSGKSIEAAGVVLAAGNLPSSRPCDGVEFRNPWTPAALADLQPDASVLIVGTGLTMIDLVMTMHARGFHGPVVALSRRGLLPHAHEAVGQVWPTPAFTSVERSTAVGLLRAVRAQLRAARAQGIGWRAVIDSLRPVTAELWGGLPGAERARFLRHLRPYWDIHRHRMAPPAAATVQTLLGSGGLRIVRGRVREIERRAGDATVTFDNRATGMPETLKVQRIIYATGLQGQRAGKGLLPTMLAAGQARLDRQELGLDVTNSLAVIDVQGNPARNLWALGPIVRGVFWECLAVPDIRLQARQLSQEIARSFTPAQPR
jgi:uncharacterized NAD(P)/FAD-binding protein YdhS